MLTMLTKIQGEDGKRRDTKEPETKQEPNIFHQPELRNNDYSSYYYKRTYLLNATHFAWVESVYFFHYPRRDNQAIRIFMRIRTMRAYQ